MERNHENENNTNDDGKKGGAWERGGIHSLSDAKIQKQEQRFKQTTLEEEEEKAEAEDKREAGGSSLLLYLGFNEKQTDDSVFQERLKPRYQAAGSRDSCGLFSLGRGWQELYAARAGCGGSSRGGGAFEDEEDEEDENTRDKNNTNTTKKKKTTKSSYFFSTKTSTKKARERC
jgi:hypothetical protein